MGRPRVFEHEVGTPEYIAEKKEKDAKRYADNKELYRIRKALWYENNRSKVNYAAQRRRAMKKSLRGFLPPNFEEVLYSVFGGRYCLQCQSVDFVQVDHVVSLSEGGRDALTNLQFLCRTHNVAKGGSTHDYRTPEQQASLRKYVSDNSHLARVAVVVPVMKNFKGFTELMQSIDVSVRPFVYDNWTDNDGVTIAWNRSIKKAIDEGYEYIFVINDDTTFAPGTMVKMMESLDEGFDLVSPQNTRDCTIQESKAYTDGPDFASFAITPRTIEKFGWFDEQIHSYFNDNDYHYRIRIGNGKSGARVDAGFYHVGSVTQNWDGDQVVTSPAFEATRDYYIHKWGGVPGHETLTTPNTSEVNEYKEMGVGFE